MARRCKPDVGAAVIDVRSNVMEQIVWRSPENPKSISLSVSISYLTGESRLCISFVPLKDGPTTFSTLWRHSSRGPGGEAARHRSRGEIHLLQLVLKKQQSENK